jgi:hypothetical protein
MNRWTLRLGSLLAFYTAGCSSPSAMPAPTYARLYADYLAPGTPGHCATSGCHADPAHNVWLCASPESCYDGMLDMDLIDAAHPERSSLVDPSRSPLVWFNPMGGSMPLDAQSADSEEAREAIAAWIAAGARRD